MGSVGCSALLVMLAFAGCLGGDDGVPDHLIADATQPFGMRGYTYDGQGIVVGTGTALVDVTESTASGRIVANATLGGETWSITWDTFRGDSARPFQKMGIARDFQEHGASGVGDANLPEMHLMMAGWGDATLTVNGERVVDPLTGRPTLYGHFMITDTGVFDDASRRVLNADGSAPYVPAQAANGRTVPGDRELHIILRSDPDATPHADNSTTGSGALGPQTPTGSFQFTVMAVPASLAVSVAVAPPVGGLPVTPAQVNVTLLSPSGQTLRAADLGGQTQRTQAAWELDATESGTYVVAVSGRGLANWRSEASVDYPAPVFYYLVYEEVAFRE